MWALLCETGGLCSHFYDASRIVHPDVFGLNEDVWVLLAQECLESLDAVTLRPRAVTQWWRDGDAVAIR